MADFKTISVDDLRASKTNPRKTFGESALLELAESIKTQGILQPILVRPSKGQYEIVCGERRFRAARIAGLAEVPCIVRTMTDAEVLDAQIVENLQRQDVHPLEESACIAKLLKSKIYDSEQAVADKIGRPVEFVRRRLKLSDLHKSVKKALEEEQITIGWAELVSTIPPKDQVEAFTQLGFWNGPKTVADLKNWIKSRFRHQELTNANFDLDDLTLLPVAGSCLICPKNSKLGLFPDGVATCSDSDCFRAKTDAFNERKIAKAKEEHSDAVELSWDYSGVSRGLPSREWRLSEDEDAEVGIFVEGGRIGEVVRFKRNVFQSSTGTEQTKAERKALTIKNLTAAEACNEGMEWITPILKERGGATKARKLMILEKRFYFEWAYVNGFDVTTGCADELREAGLMQCVSNSGDYGSSSNSGVGGSSSNSGFRGSSSNSGEYGSSSNSGDYGSSSNSGDYGSSSNSGVGGSSSNSGAGGYSSNSGAGGYSSNSGFRGSSSNSGVGGYAANFASGGRVMAEIDGCTIIAAYWTDNGKVSRIVSGVTGEDGIEKGVWYKADSENKCLRKCANQDSPKTGPEVEL